MESERMRSMKIGKKQKMRHNEMNLIRKKKQRKKRKAEINPFID